MGFSGKKNHHLKLKRGLTIVRLCLVSLLIFVLGFVISQILNSSCLSLHYYEMARSIFLFNVADSILAVRRRAL